MGIEVMKQQTADEFYTMLICFNKICEQVGVKYWLMCGTLLGAARERAILSWDKDVDIGMLESERKVLWENRKIIKDWGLDIAYADYIYRVNYKNVYMDVFSFALKFGKYQEIHFRNRNRFNEYFYPKQLFPLKQIRLGPLILPAPNLTGDWLSQTYGKWYEMPKQYRHLHIHKIDASTEFKDKLVNFIPYPRYLVNPANIKPNKLLEKPIYRINYCKAFVIILIITIIYYCTYGR